MSEPYIKRILDARVYEVARETPVDEALLLSKRFGNRIWLKREDLQSVFSFKLRGAYNKMHGLSAAQRARGVIAASAGNHAQGVAMAAQKLAVPATIVMPRTTPGIKVNAVRARGAQVVLHGDSFDEAAVQAQALVAQKNLTYVHPFDDPDVIAGHRGHGDRAPASEPSGCGVRAGGRRRPAGGDGGFYPLRVAANPAYRR